METTSCIEQIGVIESIQNGLARVLVTNFSACSTCHSKGACGVTGSESMKLDVPVPDTTYSKGDRVYISMVRSLGMRAALIAYILPFIIVIALLLTLTSFNVSELITGITSLLVLVPYFISLYLFRDRLKRTFTFTLRKEG